jgi:hypothetical protein
MSASAGSDGAWTIKFPASELQKGDEISIRLSASFNGFYIIQPLETRTYAGQSIEGIAVGNVTVTTKLITGTIANLPEEMYDEMYGAYIMALTELPPETENILDAGVQYVIGRRALDGSHGTWALKVPSGSPALWFLVEVYDGGTFRYFVTKSASSAATVSLDIETMTKITAE